MKDKKYHKSILFILLLPAGILLSHFSSLVPEFIEQNYSKGIYRPVGRGLSIITGIIPISAAELIVMSLIVFIIWKLTHIIIKIARKSPGGKHDLLVFLSNAIVLISIIYFVFNVIWGLNYYRLPFSTIAGLDTRPASVGELEEVCQSIIERANELQDKVARDSEGVMQTFGGPFDVLGRAYKGYEKASYLYPELKGRFGRPKGVMLSYFMCYTGITGVYFPFTGEANVNIAIPDVMLPSTASHEMAHQRGFAREDEANYIAYLTCNMHPDADFKYSGTILALLHSMNALYGHDREAYTRLSAKYSEGLKRDLAYNNKFWQRFEGPIEEISDEINNAYLKANRQKEGVYSYGRMVDLLIAEHRLKKNK